MELTAARQAMPGLAQLHMCNCKLECPSLVTALAAALQFLTQLQQLRLAGAHLGEVGVAALAPVLSGMPGLQTLDVGRNLIWA